MWKYLYALALVAMTFVALLRMVAVLDRIERRGHGGGAIVVDIDQHTLSFVAAARGPAAAGAVREAGGNGGDGDDTGRRERRRGRENEEQVGGGDDSTEDDGEGAFGSCLKIMDDNHWLVEWLAYHYFVLPLRHLTVMIDPKSRTSPLPILDRWRGRMTIVVVNETYEDAKVRSTNVRSAGAEEHLGPQRGFLADCFRSYKRMGWEGWIIATDTDEFVGINPAVRTATNPDDELYRGDVLAEIPGNGVPGSVSKMLSVELRRRKDRNMQVEFPDCIAMNRMQICIDENAETKRMGEQLTPEGLGLSYKDFLTQRFLLGGEQLRPKDMVHIGGIEKEYFDELDLTGVKGASHYVVPGRCKQGAPRRKSVFQAYHYDGTMEQRTFRVDPRGKYGERMGTTPQKPGSCPKFPADDVRPWLTGFVEAVGVEEAARLLEGNGRVDGWPEYIPPPNQAGVGATARRTTKKKTKRKHRT